MNALRMGLLGAIGGFAQGQANEIARSDDEKFKMQMLNAQLDSKHEIAQATNATTLYWHGQMEDNKKRFQDQIDARDREREADKHQHGIDMMGYRYDAMDARQKTAGIAAELSNERLLNGKTAQDRAAQEKEDDKNRVDLRFAVEQADKKAMAFDGYPDASAYQDYGIDAKDPHRNVLLKQAMLQEEFSRLSKKTKTFAAQQGVDLTPFDSLSTRFKQPATTDASIATPPKTGYIPASPSAQNGPQFSSPTQAPGATSPPRPTTSFTFNPQTGQLEPDQ